MQRRPDTVAVVDLGSNSFHMVVAVVRGGRLQVIDRLREPVRIAAGMDAQGRLAPDARARALDCLQRFGQRLKGIPGVRVRAVGTNALRSARAAATFLARAERSLGHPIEIISGREEARLIYLGVAYDLADTPGIRRLVLDIGGGSTEIIIGEGRKSLERESLSMGCVTWSERFFPGGRLSASRFDAARTAARLELQAVDERYAALGWTEAIGTSGTVRAIRDAAGGRITAEALEKLCTELRRARSVRELQLRGLAEDRAEIFAGGLAILAAVFDALKLTDLAVSDMALREGLLYDLVGRAHADVRDGAVATLARLYGIDTEHAAQVNSVAQAAFEQLARRWKFLDEHRKWLRWAAQLHDIGLQVSHSSYHKHGAYLLQHSDMPGFSRQEQAVLALLVRGHRRKLDAEAFEVLPPDWVAPALHLCVILRIAVLLRRARSTVAAPAVKWRATPLGVSLTFPKGWLQRNPLTHADLERERDALREAGVRLTYR